MLETCVLICSFLIVGVLGTLFIDLCRDVRIIEAYLESMEGMLELLTEKHILDNIKQGNGLPPLSDDGGGNK